jgi:hypothetical protein
MGFPRHDYVQVESNIFQRCHGEARRGRRWRGSCRGHMAYQVATIAPPPAHCHCNRSSTLRQLSRIKPSPSLTYLSVGPPSVTPPTRTLQSVTELLLKPPCATTTIVATTAHTHKIWSPPHGGGGGGEGE